MYYRIQILSEYDLEIPQSQTADKPMTPWERVTQQSRETRKTNKAKQPTLSLPHQDNYSRTILDTQLRTPKHRTIT